MHHHLLTIDDAGGIAVSLPGVKEGLTLEGEHRAWAVNDKMFAWERPLTETDVEALTAARMRVPHGPILALATANVDEKAALLADHALGAFDIAHLSDLPVYLLELGRATSGSLREAVIAAWLATAPADLAGDFRAHNA